ncbi:MAG: hypothetical protein ACI9M9_002248, partial [Flavobacteriaceae bacterium]
MCHKILEILTKSIKRKLDTYNVLIKLRNSTFAHMALQKNVKIKNRKARFEYEILDTYSAGIVLAGTEIKAIREG